MFLYNYENLVFIISFTKYFLVSIMAKKRGKTKISKTKSAKEIKKNSELVNKNTKSKLASQIHESGKEVADETIEKIKKQIEQLKKKQPISTTSDEKPVLITKAFKRETILKKPEQITIKNETNKTDKTTSVNDLHSKHLIQSVPTKKEEILKVMHEYEFYAEEIPIKIRIIQKKGEFVPVYEISIADISLNTEIILESIKKEIIREVNLGMVDIINAKNESFIREKFERTIRLLIDKYFPDADEETTKFLTTYLIQKSLGMGKIEILMADNFLEEIAINSSEEPVWVYHRQYGWLKTNIFLKDEDQTKHYATMIARKVGRQITILNPLLDATLETGDRVNATLLPISNRGNTITLRKFAAKPWTITDLIKIKTITPEAASLIWLGIQYELSGLISGGTGSGKTSTLNVISHFFPPNQRIVSIEDTREIKLPRYLHWVPMLTRPANPEGKGEISMEDLLVNSLRQRPDRIIVGEIRRKREAEVLFEAVHTGHSVYATVHANTAEETITRLTNPPIDVPSTMLPAISMLIVQFRNRRLNVRRTLQFAEITPDSKARVLMQLDFRKDRLVSVNPSIHMMKTLQMFTGFSKAQFKRDLTEKQQILKYLVKQNINTVDGVGRIIAEYYTNKQNLLKYIKKNKKFPL